LYAALWVELELFPEGIGAIITRIILHWKVRVVAAGSFQSESIRPLEIP